MRHALSITIVLHVARLAHAQPAEPAPEPPSTPEPPPAQPSPPPPPLEVPPRVVTSPDDKQLSVTYDKGLTFAAHDNHYKLKLTFRNQVRFETTRPTEDNSQFASHFLIPRTRLQADGHAFDQGTRYKLEFSLHDSGNFAFLRDLYIDQRLTTAPVWLRAGMWKRPFNRQELVADFASEFNERAITAAFAGGGRDVGLAIHDDYEKSPQGLEWAIGVFNSFSGPEERPDIGGCKTDSMGVGTCPPPTNFPADFAPALVARAGWNQGAIKGYSEGDLDGGPLRWAVGASYKVDFGNFAKQQQASVAKNLSHGAELDAMIKVSGTSIELGVYMMKIKSADAGYGAFGQIGYFVVPKKLQLAGRFAIAPDPKDADRDQIEARIAVSWFWHGHDWKWANDAGVLKTTGVDPMTMNEDKPDLVIRSMLQLVL